MAGGGAGLVEAQVIQSEEAAVGFNVVIDVARLRRPTSADVFSGHFDVVMMRSRGATDPDPNSYIYPYLDTAGGSNFTGYSNPRLDYVLANALRATDPKARAVDYRVAQQIMHADRPIIPLRENLSYAHLRLEPERHPVQPVRGPALRQRAVQVSVRPNPGRHPARRATSGGQHV